MADDIYRNYDRHSDLDRAEAARRRRGQSIFDDEGRRGGSRNDDRERGYGRGRDEDRGFFEKAGEEIRSWFSDDDDRDERSRYGRERGRYEERGERGGYPRYDSNRSYGDDYDRRYGGTQSWGQANDMRDEPSRRTGSRQDDHYRTWRERQMAELDRDYEDYCRERQQQFDDDFSTWRSQREQSRSGGMSGAGRGSDGEESRKSAGSSRATTGGASAETAKSGDADSSVKSSASASQGRSTTRSRS